MSDHDSITGDREASSSKAKLTAPCVIWPPDADLGFQLELNGSYMVTCTRLPGGKTDYKLRSDEPEARYTLYEGLYELTVVGDDIPKTVFTSGMDLDVDLPLDCDVLEPLRRLKKTATMMSGEGSYVIQRIKLQGLYGQSNGSGEKGGRTKSRHLHGHHTRGSKTVEYSVRPTYHVKWVRGEASDSELSDQSERGSPPGSDAQGGRELDCTSLESAVRGDGDSGGPGSLISDHSGESPASDRDRLERKSADVDLVFEEHEMWLL